MVGMYMYMLIALTAAVVSGGIVAILYHHKNKAMYDRLNSMLDAAIAGSFAEKSYDESRLSQVETKLNRFLRNAVAGERDMSMEKERIKMLISDISHQTKTPIANIMLYVQLLQEQEDRGSSSTELSNQIAKQAKKLNFLIQALIKTSRMEAGIIHVNPQANRIKDVILRVVTQVEEQAQLKQIHLRVDCEDDSTALFDPKWTEEALFNIVDNSVKYTAEHGMVTISSTTYELFSRIDITDTGMGLVEQEIHQIFKRFYRSPKVHEIEGVGIGLYIAREIVAMQKGYIKVSSVLHEGSTFSVFLPNDIPKSFKTDRFQKEP